VADLKNMDYVQNVRNLILENSDVKIVIPKE
jgi:hypothetical protein